MVLKIVIGIVAVIVVFVIVVASRPATFHVERSITIAALPENAFIQVNDFHAWTAWSPYEKLDPQLKRTYDGARSGVGAGYAWAGNSKAGEGRMTIERSEIPSLIVIKLEFTKPIAATNTATFTFLPGPQGTKVTWAMDGENNFGAKAFQLFVNMDRLVGDEFEHGLAQLKSVAENTSRADVEAVRSTK